MRIVMTLRVRDQADLVDALVSFHLNVGVDFVIATDHRSHDGTTEILEAYEQEGCLRLIREEGEEVRGAEWRTRMARLAAIEHGADWVVNSDGDEFWWPRYGDLSTVLAQVPQRYGAVRCAWRPFLPRPDEVQFFAERMTIRLSPAAPLNDPASPYRPNLKVAHRADPRVVVDRGSHSVSGAALELMPGLFPIEVLHFPLRGARQMLRKHETWWEQLPSFGARARYVRGQKRNTAGRSSAYYAALAVEGGELESGLAAGMLVEDSRLREALRRLKLSEPRGARRFALPSELDEPLVLPRPTAKDETGYATDAAILEEAELARLHRRLDLAGRSFARIGSGER